MSRTSTRTLFWSIAAASLWASSAAAAPPPITAIRFVGNEVTKPRTMLREMSVAVGDPADPEAIETSRQAVMNLGLFKRVTTALEPTPAGTELLVTVEEKFYIVPVPRADLNGEADFSFGMSLKWDNLTGLDQRLTLRWVENRPSDVDRGDKTSYSWQLEYPLLGNSSWDLLAGMAYSATPLDDERIGGLQTQIRDTHREFLGVVVRALSDHPTIQGWRIGGGLLAQSDTFSGPDAPESPGRAIATVVLASFDNRDRTLYRDVGQVASIRWDFAREGAGSDYDFSRIRGSWEWFTDVGGGPNRTFHVLLAGGVYNGGRDLRPEFKLGGTSTLRGFDKDSFEGNLFYRGRFEYLRPITRSSSIRALFLIDYGEAFAERSDVDLSRVPAAFGFGIRWRVKWFVDVEIDVGFARPFDGGNFRFFGGTVD